MNNHGKRELIVLWKLLKTCKNVLEGLRNMITEDFLTGADKKYRVLLDKTIKETEEYLKSNNCSKL